MSILYYSKEFVNFIFVFVTKCLRILSQHKLIDHHFVVTSFIQKITIKPQQYWHTGPVQSEKLIVLVTGVPIRENVLTGHKFTNLLKSASS